MESRASDTAMESQDDFSLTDPTWAFMLRLRRMTQLYTASWVRLVSAEVTSTQFGVMNFLERFPGESQKDIGAHLSMDKSNMTDVVNRLTRRGHVRVLKDANDQRRNVLMLTKEGQRVLAELTPLVHHLRAEAFQTFSAEERLLFLGGMDQLIARLEQIVKAES
ncbi:MarR family winged helix-turn-helix transcriptional regulator [Leucobacter sp. wl10]|uniref:MarR family winged helix-turn-helix transcriptional regulator n=1 Tax=Leucobacter sp. wl10 TaxID=2304677 RepID=UPI000E5B1A46|nr:MarR family transcriptional regulator [Leucobacter sp. wl10]RGE19300.1 MarR family transcriptional regulator [Leucobacter sp. wl10]